MRRRRCGGVLLVTLALTTGACSGGDRRANDGGRIDPSDESTTAPTTVPTTAPTAASTTAAVSPTTAPPTTRTTSPPTTRKTAPPTTRTTAPPTTLTTAPPATKPPPAPVALIDVAVRLTQVAKLEQPLDLAQRPGDDTLYVAEKTGRVRAVSNGTVAPEAVLDLSSEVSAGGEQGLLGITFSADGNLLYASFTNREGDSRLWEYAFAGGRADPGTKRELLAQDQPFANHNGGQVSFGPDGLLYYALGDGGSGGDPMNNAQNLGNLLGKLLRIDPRPSGAAPYTIPPDNPFVGRPGARGEIWAYGLRNPWRSSWDRLTGDLWTGDVGQNTTEEIDHRPGGAGGAGRGANFGWSIYEGSQRFKPGLPSPPDYVPPVYEYPTGDGCSVTSGYVYRGTRVVGLQGAYLFGDYCNGRIQALRLEGEKVVEKGSLGPVVDQLTSFAQDHAGEVYALSGAGGLFRIDPA